jgi:4-carboxymuconolactone decarboxylase
MPAIAVPFVSETEAPSSMSKPEASQATLTPRTPAPKVAPAEIQTGAPGLAWYTDNILFGEQWERPELSKRDRSIVTVAALISRAYTGQLTGHFNRALAHGVLPAEILEIITHLAFYAGWPCAMQAFGVMQQVFAARGIGPEQVTQSIGNAACAAAQASGAQGVATAMQDFTDRVLLGDLWRRSELAARDRSLVTICAVIAQGQHEQLPAQVKLGLENGLNKSEIREAISHLAFYAGWPRATSAMDVVGNLFGDGG